MTPSYAVKKGTRYRYYVSRPLITQDQRESSTALRIPAAEIEHLLTSRVRQWLLDPGGIYQATRLADPSAQRRLIARAAEIGKSWTELTATRQRAGGRNSNLVHPGAVTPLRAGDQDVDRGDRPVCPRQT